MKKENNQRSSKALKLLTLLFLTLVLFVFAGCSSKGKGDKDGNGLSEAELNAQREGRFGAGNIPSAEGGGLFRDVFFDYDSSTVSPEARADIEYNANILQDQSTLRIVIEGHCDERGTAEYNMALGSQRAAAVKEILVSFGVSSGRLETISYGEEVPLDPAHDESAWAKNRRAHISAYSDTK